MIIQLNEDKLPIKYILGIHEQLPSYPDGFDILYEKVRRHVGEKKPNLLRRFERFIKKEIDESLQVLHEEKKDLNKIRRL